MAGKIEYLGTVSMLFSIRNKSAYHLPDSHDINLCMFNHISFLASAWPQWDAEFLSTSRGVCGEIFAQAGDRGSRDNIIDTLGHLRLLSGMGAEVGYTQGGKPEREGRQKTSVVASCVAAVAKQTAEPQWTLLSFLYGIQKNISAALFLSRAVATFKMPEWSQAHPCKACFPAQKQYVCTAYSEEV